MPNTDKTNGYHKKRYSRLGSKLITVDWSAQLITLGIISKNKKYIQAVNSGDQHVSTTIEIYSDQKIRM